MLKTQQKNENFKNNILIRYFLYYSKIKKLQIFLRGLRKNFPNRHSDGSRNLYYQRRYWIPVFTGMTKWEHLHGNDNKILDSPFHGNDKMKGFSLIDNIENWIPIYTGMTKKMEILDSRFHENDKMEGFSLIDNIENWIPVYTGMTKWRFFQQIF